MSHVLITDLSNGSYVMRNDDRTLARSLDNRDYAFMGHIDNTGPSIKFQTPLSDAQRTPSFHFTADEAYRIVAMNPFLAIVQPHGKWW